MQEVAANMAISYIRNYKHNPDKKWFEISGAAGTGKTTVVREIINRSGIDIMKVMFVAFVGKATLALRMNGLNAKTIHSSIYDLVKTYETDNWGNVVIKDGKPVYKSHFVKKTKLDGDPSLIVLDEGGMVAESMASDLLSFGIPMIVLGDKHQLPPVFGNSIFLIRPDVTLNEIMRQSKDSPIIYLSQLAMYGYSIPYGSYGNDECLVIKKRELTDELLKQADIVICGKNSTRDTLNTHIRSKIYGISDKNLCIGDKLICRQNNWDRCMESDNNIALVNGLIGYVDAIYYHTKSGASMEIDFRPEFTTDKFKSVEIEHNYIFTPYEKRKTINTMYASGIIFELGYCITCHLSQGSQYDTVLVYVDIPNGKSDYYQKWLYTAITRAKKRLIVVI